ncbi:MAG: hypothetical protein ACRCVW_00260 [Brevinema sp.]
MKKLTFLLGLLIISACSTSEKIEKKQTQEQPLPINDSEHNEQKPLVEIIEQVKEINIDEQKPLVEIIGQDEDMDVELPRVAEVRGFRRKIFSKKPIKKPTSLPKPTTKPKSKVSISDGFSITSDIFSIAGTSTELGLAASGEVEKEEITENTEEN